MISRNLSAVASRAVMGAVVGGALFCGVFTVASTESSAQASDGTTISAVGAINDCGQGCENNAKVCVKKCVVEQKPCMDKCDIDEKDNPKYLKPKDQNCLKSCFDKSRPCQQRCQANRASCARSCPN